MVTLSGEGFVSGVTGCRFGSSSVVEAEVLSSSEATCVSPAGVRGQQVLELSTPSISTSVFMMEDAAEVSSVEPSMVSATGGESILVVSEGTPVSCLFDGRVSVSAHMVGDGSSMACRTVAMPAGNTSVQVSVNGQEWSTSAVSMELVGAMNVSSVEPVVVSSVGGTEVVLTGSGFMAASSGVYCGVGGLSWSSSKASVLSGSEARCVLPARGDGMRVVEVSVSAGGELSHSGVQVEYMGASEVHSVWPSSGGVSGGSVVTLSGEGFVSGVTG